jgi:Tfp pilus assembly protein PilX
MHTMQRSPQAGHALILMLVFMAVAMMIATSATAVTMTLARASSDYSLGQDALNVADSGIDNAILRFDRDRTYTGETLTVGTGTATITVSGTGPYTITSTGTVGSFKRKIQAVVTITNNVIAITSWKETP